MSNHILNSNDIHTKDAPRDLRRAWIAVAMIPVAFVVVTVLGEFVIAALGYPSGGNKTAPTSIRVAVGIPATLVLMSPAVIAGIYGLRARREGEPRGLWPAIVGIAATAIFLVQTIASFILQG